MLVFTPVCDYTVEHDLYMQHWLEETGITACLSVEARRAEAVFEAVTTTPHAPKLLAGLVKLTTDPWTASVAAATEVAIVATENRGALLELLFTELERYFLDRAKIIEDFSTVLITGATGHLTPREPVETRGARQYGQWDDALRVLAGYNPDILQKQLRWHLRDFLLAYEHQVKQAALLEYRHQTSVYAAVAPYAKKGTLKPPKVPRVLKGRRQNG